MIKKKCSNRQFGTNGWSWRTRGIGGIRGGWFWRKYWGLKETKFDSNEDVKEKFVDPKVGIRKICWP